MMELLQQATERTRRWLETVVVGLDLCPFAAGPWQAGRVRIVASPAGDFDAAIVAVAGEIQRLVETPESELSSTLVTLPATLSDFEDFLDVVHVLGGLLEEVGAEHLVQLAHFHPDYRFEGVPADDVTNHTNRAPFPTLHLLRVDEVGRALDSHGDGLSIPHANMARLAELGTDGVAAIWSTFMGPDPEPPEGGEA